MRMPIVYFFWGVISLFPLLTSGNKWAVEQTASKVLLLAAGRSGSTFVGEMLNQARNSFYLYEPCRSLEGEAGVARFSIRFAKTGPQGLVSAAIRSDRHLAFMNACKGASIRAVKEVRIVEGDKESVEEGVVAQLLTSGVRILHLVRDPRGVISSRLQLWQFCRSKGIVQCSPEVCDSYRNTLDALDRVLTKFFSYTGSNQAPSKQYLRIKYEDVAIEPVDSLARIYQWSGIGMVEPRINEWVFSTTHASSSDNAFRIQRNATKVAFAWRSDLTQRQIQIANRNCGDVLVRLGYGSKEEVQAAVNSPLPPKYGGSGGKHPRSGRAA